MVRRINIDNLTGENGYSKWGAYGQSKLANLLFTLELQRRLEADDLTVTCSAAHPGWAATGLQSAGPKMSDSWWEARIAALANTVLAQSAKSDLDDRILVDRPSCGFHIEYNVHKGEDRCGRGQHNRA